MARATGFVRLGCWLSAAVLLATPCRGIDLTVGDIEVTQGIQDTGNHVPLVAGRLTAVRVRIDTTGVAAGLTVTGKLHVSVGGTRITPPAGIDSLPPPLSPPPPGTFVRENEAHTLNFEIPASVRLPESAAVTFRVEFTSNPADEKPANNWKELALPVVRVATPRILYTAVTYQDPPVYESPADGDAMLRALLPFEDTAGLYVPMPTYSPPPRVQFWYDPDGDCTINQLDEVNELLRILEAWRAWAAAGDSETFLYGWANFGVSSHGWAAGQVAFGNMEPPRRQRTFAHEMAHLLGLGHNGRTIDQVGWDCGARMGSGRTKCAPLFDLMVPARLTRQAWIDTTTYGRLLAANACAGGGPAPDGPDDVMVTVQGVLDRTGARVDRKHPVFEYPRPVRPTRGAESGRHVAEVALRDGQVRRVRFDARIFSEEEAPKDESEPYGFFSIAVPAPRGAAVGVRIRDTVGDSGVVASWERSANPPRIEGVSPASGSQLAPGTVLSWKASDPDGPEITFQVVLSADRGKTFLPIGIGLEERGLTLPGWLFGAGARDDVLIRIFASDGFNTVSVDVDKLQLRAQ